MDIFEVPGIPVVQKGKAGGVAEAGADGARVTVGPSAPTDPRATDVWVDPDDDPILLDELLPVGGDLAGTFPNPRISDAFKDQFALKDAVPPAYQQFISSLVVNNLFLQTMAVETGYIWGVVDQDGRLALGLKLDGTLVAKLALASGSVPLAALAADVQAHLMDPAAVAALQALATESGYGFAITDQNGHAALTVESDGSISAKVNLQPGSVSFSALAADVQAHLLQSVAIESGYSFAVVDQDGRLGMGVDAAGHLVGNIGLDPAVNEVVFTATPDSDGTTLAYVVTDGAGRRQIRTEALAGGAVVAITTDGDNVDPQLVPGGFVVWRRKSPTATAYTAVYAPVGGGVINPVLPTGITALGDSLSAAGAYEAYLSSLLPGSPSIFINATGGETSIGIAARSNAVPTLLTLTGNQIPATTDPVAVTVSSAGIPSSQGSQVFAGSLMGVPGTLARATDGSRTFTRTAPGSAVAVPAGSPFYLDIAVAHRSDLWLIWAGRNNYSSRAQVLSDVAAMVGYISSLGKRYLVLSVINGAGETIGTSNYTSLVTNLNGDLAAAYGANFVDVRRRLIDQGLAEAGIAPTAQDTADVAGDTVPASLRTDAIHLITAGYQTVARAVRDRLLEKGWF